MKLRIATLIALLFTALPVWAHGEQLIAVLLGGFLLIPAALFLFIPWHHWWARFAAVAVLVLSTIVFWFVVMPKIEKRPMSGAEEWLWLLAPIALTVIFAIVLRKSGKRHAG